MKHIKGILLTEEGDLKEVDVANTDGSHLASMYELLECRTVECVSLTDNIDLWVDEEFVYTQQAPNLELTLTAVMLGWPGQHLIKGKGLFLSVNYEEGETIALNETQKQLIRSSYVWAKNRVFQVIIDKLQAESGGSK